jgi:hypothetical protein
MINDGGVLYVGAEIFVKCRKIQLSLPLSLSPFCIEYMQGRSQTRAGGSQAFQGYEELEARPSTMHFLCLFIRVLFPKILHLQKGILEQSFLFKGDSKENCILWNKICCFCVKEQIHKQRCPHSKKCGKHVGKAVGYIFTTWLNINADTHS